MFSLRALSARIAGRYVVFVLFILSSQGCGTSSSFRSEETPDTSTVVARCGDTVRIGEALDVPHDGDNGIFDPSLEYDPERERLWMSFSSVLGPAGTARVSTHLAYSDDGGATWCRQGVVNPAQAVPPNARPFQLREFPTHWNHEVSTLVRNPSAPGEVRWQLMWHRYLEAVDEDPSTEDRRFAYGWIGLKAAASPEGLVEAPEQKLFVATGYRSVRDYNDDVVGPPVVDWSNHPDLSRCLAFTEPGALVDAGVLYMSVVCAELSTRSVVLLRNDPIGMWSLVGTPIDAADAQTILRATLGPGAPTVTGVSASELVHINGATGLVVSPIVDNYRGCWFFSLDVASAQVLGRVGGAPGTVIDHTQGTLLSGVCDYHAAARATGVLFGEATRTNPQFQIYPTGIVPRP